jgi:hypothetical protein
MLLLLLLLLCGSSSSWSRRRRRSLLLDGWWKWNFLNRHGHWRSRPVSSSIVSLILNSGRHLGETR